VDRAIRESSRRDEPLRTALLLRRGGRPEEALELLERLWGETVPEPGQEPSELHLHSAELLSDLLQSRLEDASLEQGPRVNRLANLGFPGAQELLSAWFPAAASLVGQSASVRALRAFLFEHAQTSETLVLWGESGAGHALTARVLHALSRRVGFHEAYERAPRHRLLAQVERDLAAEGGTLYLSYAREPADWEEVEELCEARGARLVVGMVVPREPTLAGPSCELPALRDRFEDLPLLVEELFARAERPGVTLSEGALEVMRMHDWPGNVRELANHVSRTVLTLQSEDVTLEEELLQGLYGLPGQTG